MIDNNKHDYAPPCIINEKGEFNSSNSYYDELKEYIETGLNNEKAFLRSCRAFNKAEIGMAVLYGDTFRKEFKGPSTLQIKKSRRQTREAIANQSDIRQSWTIRTNKPDDELCQDQVNDINRLANDWWNTLFVDRVVKGANQYGGGHGTGYIFMWPEYDELFGDWQIVPTFLDYKSVLVGHIPPDNDIQKAYRLDIILETPLPLAHAKWPDHVGIIKADTEIPSRMARNFEKKPKVYKGLWDWMGKKKKRDSETSLSNPFPNVYIRMTFIRDASVNESGKTICMGQEPNYYEVPSYYDEDGKVNKVGTGTFLTKYYDAIGNEVPEGSSFVRKESVEVMRDFKRRECKLFPYGRLIISCSGGIISDDAPQWGDGTFPVAQCYYDKIAGEFLGFPVAMDSISIENSINNIYQAMEDSVLGKINPPIGIDNSIPDDIANVIKQRGIRGLIGKGFKYSVQHLQKAVVTLVDWQFFTIGAEVFKLVELLQTMQDYVSGTQDMAGMMQLKQMPGEETQEALLRKLGVLSTDQARDQEKFFQQLGRIWFSFCDQVYTVKRRLQVIGPDAIKPEYIDFDPASFERVYKDDKRPRWIIRREHMKNFSVYVAPNSIQERQSTQKKLSLLQVQKMGGTIPDQMIYDAFVGDDNYKKNRELYFEEQMEKAKAAAKIQAEVQKIMQSLGAGGNGNSNGVQTPIIQQIAEALSAKFENDVGRPPTNDAPARLESKMRDGVPDTTLATN